MSEAASLPPVPHVAQRMRVDGETLRLVGLAEEVAERFLAEFPDDAARYGERGHEWCVHDNHYLLAWAVSDLRHPGLLQRRVAWLQGVLAVRGYPAERLARDLEIAADVVEARHARPGAAIGERLRGAAAAVRDAGADGPAPDA